MFQLSVFQTWPFEFEEKTEEARFPLWTCRPIPKICGIKTFRSLNNPPPSPDICAGLSVRKLLVLTPVPAFSPPPQKCARRHGPLLHAAPKDEEQASGSRLYLLERERIREGVMDFFFKGRKKKAGMKKRGRQSSVAMVTEIWLLFKNLECRWW